MATPSTGPPPGRRRRPSDRRVLDALKVVSEIAGLHRTMPPSAGERPAELFAGDVWAHLTLREVIGRGAYGVVYRAWDPQLDREVALKLISESSQRDQAMIVVDEGRLLAKVRHRGVVTVFGAAREAGFAGLWMELIQGATFEEIVQQQGRFSAREAALFGAEVCEALAAVHSAGLLHRDVKAQNVMRDRSGRVVLMDFGTGRLRELPDEAAVADLAGTPLYMAPELFSGGVGRDADRRLQRRRAAVPAGDRQLSAAGPLARRGPARPRAEPGQAAARRAIRSAVGVRQHRRAGAGPRSGAPLHQRRRARARAHRLPGDVGRTVDVGLRLRQPRRRRRAGPPPPAPPTWTDRLRRAWPLAAMLAVGVAGGVAGGARVAAAPPPPRRRRCGS